MEFSILEAAACGIPSITSNVGGLPEVNLNEKTGYTIKANDSQKLADLIIMYYKNNKKRKIWVSMPEKMLKKTLIGINV